MTAAVRPARESAPQREMTSAAARRSAPRDGAQQHEKHRLLRDAERGQQRRSSAPMLGSPEARSRYIAGKSTTSAGENIPHDAQPFAAPAVSAEKTSSPRQIPAMQAAPMMSAGTSPRAYSVPQLFHDRRRSYPGSERHGELTHTAGMISKAAAAP